MASCHVCCSSRSGQSAYQTSSDRDGSSCAFILAAERTHYSCVDEGESADSADYKGAHRAGRTETGR